jgi:UDP-N-acetylmuramoylalanine--D-glutamate ligase
VLVLGLGRHGGGVEATRFLRSEGAEVRVTDTADRTALAGPAADIEALGGEVVFGPQDAALLDDRDLVLASPAIPFDHPVLQAAAERGIAATTEINIVLARLRAPVVGITGTKGKSTTTALITSMLAASGRRVHQGGNIGRPLVARLDAIAADDVVVLELSSFQLWWTRRIDRAPHVTVVTNLFPEHLDRHGDMAHYAAAKRAALDAQGPGDVAVLPADDDAVREAGWWHAGAARRLAWGAGGEVVLEGTTAVGPFGRADLSRLRLLGPHNLRNALAAAAATAALLHAPIPAIEAGAAQTEALPHRLQGVAEVDGVLYVDDSNSTHPEATRAALAAFARPVLLIAGGKDKGADRTGLVEAIDAHVRVLIAIGTTGPALVDAVGAHVAGVCVTGGIEEAVAAAAARARPGDVVLLSPAFSSLDQYASYAERGDRFQRAVTALPAPGRPRPVC